jgi:hypothetical protein
MSFCERTNRIENLVAEVSSNEDMFKSDKNREASAKLISIQICGILRGQTNARPTQEVVATYEYLRSQVQLAGSREMSFLICRYVTAFLLRKRLETPDFLLEFVWDFLHGNIGQPPPRPATEDEMILRDGRIWELVRKARSLGSPIDCDDDSLELVAAMEARFGVSPVHVKTPRGLHLYYRANGKPPNLRGEGLLVDIKTGPRAYVVGPLSQRPDGGLYVPAKGLLGLDAMPLLRRSEGAQSAPPPQQKARTITVGHRHATLVRKALQMVEYVDSPEELAANLAAVRDDLCEDAVSMPDSELQGIAEWTWQCRLENRIFQGRDSAFSLHRLALDALRGWHNQTDAIAFYVMLVDMHGHTPGKRFALDFKAMRSAGLTDLSIPRLRAARRTLEAVELLKLVGKHKAGSKHQAWVLARLRVSTTDANNVTRLSG